MNRGLKGIYPSETKVLVENLSFADCFPNGKPWVVHIYVNLPRIIGFINQPHTEV